MNPVLVYPPSLWKIQVEWSVRPLGHVFGEVDSKALNDRDAYETSVNYFPNGIA
jgi:hypothetical protein